MLYKVKIFASLKEGVGSDHWEYQADHALMGSELLHAFFAAFQQLDGLKRVTRLAVNQAFCADDPLLKEEDEIALIPPVSGG